MNSCANSLQLRVSEVQNFIAAQLPVHHQGANTAESTGLTPGKSEGYAILLARVDDYEAVEGRETMGNMDIWYEMIWIDMINTARGWQKPHATLPTGEFESSIQKAFESFKDEHLG